MSGILSDNDLCGVGWQPLTKVLFEPLQSHSTPSSERASGVRLKSLDRWLANHGKGTSYGRTVDIKAHKE